MRNEVAFKRVRFSNIFPWIEWPVEISSPCLWFFSRWKWQFANVSNPWYQNHWQERQVFAPWSSKELIFICWQIYAECVFCWVLWAGSREKKLIEELVSKYWKKWGFSVSRLFPKGSTHSKFLQATKLLVMGSSMFHLREALRVSHVQEALHNYGRLPIQGHICWPLI